MRMGRARRRRTRFYPELGKRRLPGIAEGDGDDGNQQDA